MKITETIRELTPRVRRKAFDASSVLRAVATNRHAAEVKHIPTYWWAVEPNFGDMLMPDLMSSAGGLALRSEPQEARLFGVGSILKWVPDDFDGYIWGSGGKSADEACISSPGANVVALRGHLSAEANGLAERDIALGDPGLLFGPLIKRPKPHGKVGLIPHVSHKSSEQFRALTERLGSHAVTIDVARRPRAVVRDIARCSAVISSSLHGVIIADSLGIPAAWSLEPGSFEGGEFKYHDYESVVDPAGPRQVLLSELSSLHDVSRCTQTVNSAAVAHAQRSLRGSLRDVVMDPDFTTLSPRVTLMSFPKVLR